MIRLIKRFSVLTLTFFFNDTATTEIYTLSLHDALPIYSLALKLAELDKNSPNPPGGEFERNSAGELTGMLKRSEEHTSELQSHLNIVCRLLLEKKKNKTELYTQDTRVQDAVNANVTIVC